MREIFGRAYSIAICSIALISATSAFAQESQIINQNISGFNLPGVSLPQGQDEVRAADGTTCRSSVAGSGAYLDLGVIGNPEQSSSANSTSAYGRIVIPLGKKPPRLDCTRLYNVEVRRLELELKLMELGLTRGIAPVSEVNERATANAVQGTGSDGVEVANANLTDTQAAGSSAWDEEGWTTEGRVN
ncbi:MAG: hypothetical protein AAGF54_13345 [Pseudomonadota bacterium]